MHRVRAEALGGDAGIEVARASASDPASAGPGNQHRLCISAWLASFLQANEAMLRDRAAREVAEGRFTRGLNRCIDILDHESWRSVRK